MIENNCLIDIRMGASHFFNQYPERVLLHKQSLPSQSMSVYSLRRQASYL
jgi:hypothetical protein